jgi:hypothetical protein
MKTCLYCGTENRDGARFYENGSGFLNPSPANTTQDESVHSGNSQALAPGSYMQQGRYIIKKILGQGGMGSVGLAMDTRLADKLVVIKELLAEQGDPAKDVRNFLCTYPESAPVSRDRGGTCSCAAVREESAVLDGSGDERDIDDILSRYFEMPDSLSTGSRSAIRCLHPAPYGACRFQGQGAHIDRDTCCSTSLLCHSPSIALL